MLQKMYSIVTAMLACWVLVAVSGRLHAASVDEAIMTAMKDAPDDPIFLQNGAGPTEGYDGVSTASWTGEKNGIIELVNRGKTSWSGLLVRVDVSAFPKTTKIQRAVIYFCTDKRVGRNEKAQTAELHKMLTSWDADSVTIENKREDAKWDKEDNARKYSGPRPIYDYKSSTVNPQVKKNVFIGRKPEEFFGIEVTETIRLFIEKPSINYGFILRRPEGMRGGLKICSGTYRDKWRRPMLKIWLDPDNMPAGESKSQTAEKGSTPTAGGGSGQTAEKSKNLPAGSIWIEGESATSSNVMKHSWYDNVDKSTMSGKEWLSHFSPTNPATATFKFNASKKGKYGLWIRANFCKVKLSYSLNGSEFVLIDSTKSKDALRVSEKLDIRFLYTVKLGEVDLLKDANEIKFKFHSENSNHGAIDYFYFSPGSSSPK